MESLPGEAPDPKKKARPSPGRDAVGHEFAGVDGITETIPSAKLGPTGSGGRLLPRAPSDRAALRPPRIGEPPAPPAPAPRDAPAPAPPDPNIAGSKYFTRGGAPSEERHLAAVNRESDRDTDAFDMTLDEDLAMVARRRDRERAAAHASHRPGATEAAPESSGGGEHNLDAEARPRELDAGTPDIHKRRARKPF